MELVSIKSKSKKRIGRGLSAGGGKTAGRGTKGQKSRSGHNIPRKFEGGQTPLSMRFAKLPGFRSIHPKAAIITLDQISAAYKAGEEVSIESLFDRGLISINDRRIKVLNNGTLTVAVKFSEDLEVSKSVLDLVATMKAPKADKVEKADSETEKKESPAKPKKPTPKA